MIKLFTIIGARPQFIKAAVLSRLIRSEEWKEEFQEILLHTGQHYDDNMSDIFFRDMKIPKPDIHLAIGGSSHGKMTGQMLIEIEAALIEEKPDIVLVYGDTNSTLAGALAGSKLHIPVAHVEAGLRSYNKRMPEEQNRILTDHLASWLFCPTDTAITNLKKEGVTKGVSNVGDIMLDANLFYQEMLHNEKEKGIIRLKNLNCDYISSGYALATIHRAENTDDFSRLASIVEAFNALPLNIILPLHPRTRKILSDKNLRFGKNVQLIEPVGYLEMIELEINATCIITDSGGVQKEAYFMKKPCITLRDETEWIETVESGWNTLVGANKENIISAVSTVNLPSNQSSEYGNGRTGEKILETLYKS